MIDAQSYQLVCKWIPFDYRRDYRIELLFYGLLDTLLQRGKRFGVYTVQTVAKLINQINIGQMRSRRSLTPSGRVCLTSSGTVYTCKVNEEELFTLSGSLMGR